MMSEQPAKASIGIIGIGVMGSNLTLNLEDHGFSVAVYDRATEHVDRLLEGEGRGRSIAGARSIEELVGALEPPRRVLLMVPAGAIVDAVLDELLPLLSTGDIVIDGGNSRFTDTRRRHARLAEAGLHYIGAGISGGEAGARHGPSIMPGGAIEAWPTVRPLLQGIAATADDGTPCCEWLGPDGAGHFVKMVHNGIEYADMQLLAEAYDLLHRGAGIPSPELRPTFEAWNRGPLASYLLEIAAEIVAVADEDGAPLIDRILDAAEQHGTGRWTVVSSLELGVPAPVIAEAVSARVVSSFVDQRQRAAALLGKPAAALEGTPQAIAADLHDALYASKIVAYSEGFALMRAASTEYDWDLELRDVARIWRAGCIIRSRLLNDIIEAYERDPALESLLLDRELSKALTSAEPGWRRTVVRAVEAGLPVPALASALASYDGYRSARLPANLIQAQRDYFGAHTYERTDRPRGEHVHTEWTQARGSESGA